MEDYHHNRHLETYSTEDKSPTRLPDLELCDASDDSSSSGTQVFDTADDPSPLSSDGRSRLETSKILLIVIKMGTLSAKRVQYFRMTFDCAKCAGEDDGEIRKLRRRVKRRLKLSEPFRIFNSQGYPVQEDELSFLSQETLFNKSVVLYVSSSLCKR
jgi:hypothetical protein